jgi:arylsulfatase A-like enzyme
MPAKENTGRARRNYAAMIENIDRLTGRFVEKVKNRGEFDNTVIVYASDHGDMLGDHGKWGKGTWRDPAVRIPLIVRNPYSSHVGLRSDALVSLHDLTATFLDFAGCSQLDDMDSISLRPLLDGKCTEHREVLISEFRDWSLVFDGRYKLVLDSKKENLLFDLKTDPLEDHNIASKHPDIITKLSKSAYSDNG